MPTTADVIDIAKVSASLAIRDIELGVDTTCDAVKFGVSGIIKKFTKITKKILNNKKSPTFLW